MSHDSFMRKRRTGRQLTGLRLLTVALMLLIGIGIPQFLKAIS